MRLELKHMSDDNLVLAHLCGLRNELAAVLDNQRRDRELLTRHAARTEQSFARLDADLVEIRKDMNDMRSDLVLLENRLLDRHNEILRLARRVDDPEPGSAVP